MNLHEGWLFALRIAGIVLVLVGLDVDFWHGFAITLGVQFIALAFSESRTLERERVS